MTQKKGTPVKTEVSTSARGGRIVADQDNPSKLMGNKPKRDERRKARERKRYPGRSVQAACYSRGKPKGPVLENTLDHAVAAPTEKRGFVMSGLVRHGDSHVGMVAGRMGHTARLAARRDPCFQHPAHPLRLKTWLVAFVSHHGAKTMTQAIPLARQSARVITLASRRAAPTLPPEAELLQLHAAAANALSMALSLLRDPAGTTADLQRATARACRAATLLKRLCAAQVEGGAA